ncbi:MAG TPA: hypothetical protein VJ905_09820, partial [Halalkalibaculum sp.]|nr:hypothetical protein [Halalkalibaculum sp.]
YKSYAVQTITDIFSSEELEQSQHYAATKLESIVGWNDGTGTFTIKDLPMAAQLTPMYDILAEDITGDANKEILMWGNLYSAKPEVGRYDAGYGTVFRIEGDSLAEIPDSRSGFFVDGQVRSIKSISSKKYGRIILVARNDAGLKVFRVAGN